MKRTTLKKDGIIQDLKTLGIQKGDVLFIAADLLRTGFFVEDRATTLRSWVEIFREVVGETGTIVIPAYTKTFFRFNVDKSYVFSKNSYPESGGLSDAFFHYGDVERSKHPTNSVFASGPDAKKIISGHDSSSTSYLPYERVIELGGKNLMLGCLNEKKLAPMALHFAQETLGYSARHYLSGWLHVYYEKNDGTTDLFTRRDVGGCTSFGYKFLGHHLIENAIVISKVGRASSALIDTKKSFDIFKDQLKRNPSDFKCDNTSCVDCYGSFIYNRTGALFFWLFNSHIIISKFLKRLINKVRSSGNPPETKGMRK